MTHVELDPIDRKILSSLIQNARKPFLEIARECGISGAAIHQRVHKLEESGIITGSRLLVKPSAIGLDVCAFIFICLTEGSKYNSVIISLKNVPEVVECNFITGKYSLLVKLYCSDNDHLINILKTIQQIEGVQSTETTISLETSIERQVWVNG